MMEVGDENTWFTECLPKSGGCQDDFFGLVSSFFKLPHNGLALGAVADFGAQNCQYTTKVDAR